MQLHALITCGAGFPPPCAEAAAFFGLADMIKKVETRRGSSVFMIFVRNKNASE
jgi:hypothetical protein